MENTTKIAHLQRSINASENMGVSYVAGEQAEADLPIGPPRGESFRGRAFFVPFCNFINFFTFLPLAFKTWQKLNYFKVLTTVENTVFKNTTANLRSVSGAEFNNQFSPRILV